MSSRQNSHKNKRIKEKYRKPSGNHSDQRLKKKHAAKMPEAGMRSPEDERGLHPSGYEDVLVHNVEDIEDLEEGEAARIASKVGQRKREMMIEKAEELDVKVLNGDTNE